MLRLLTLLVIFSFIVSCTQPDNKGKDTEKSTDSKEISSAIPEDKMTIVAKVNDAPIYKYHLDDSLDDPLKEAIIREILIQKAEKEGLVEKKDLSGLDMNNPKEARQIAQHHFRAYSSMKSKVLENVNVNQKLTDKDINKYYNENIDKYTYVKTLKFTVETDEKTANKVREMLDGGSTVNDIRSEYSGQGLTIGVEEKKLSNNPLILDNLEVVKVGAISKPIRFAGKYDIYKVTEVKKVPVEKLTASIKQNIRSMKKKDAIYSYVDNLIKNKEFEVVILENGEKG